VVAWTVRCDRLPHLGGVHPTSISGLWGLLEAAMGAMRYDRLPDLGGVHPTSISGLWGLFETGCGSHGGDWRSKGSLSFHLGDFLKVGVWPMGVIGGSQDRCPSAFWGLFGVPIS